MLGNIELKGMMVLLLVLGLIVLTVGLIFFLRHKLRSHSAEELKERYSSDGKGLKARSKYPEANAFSLRSSFLLYGLVVAVSLALLSFSWTTYEETIDVSQFMDDLDEEIEVEPPRTAEPPPPPPPPPPPVIEEVPEEEIEEEDEPEFVDESVDEETIVEDAPVAEVDEPEPVVEPEEEPEDEIFRIVEQMPRFPGCEDAGSEADKKQCADNKMLQYVYKHLKYPTIARENGIEGSCVLQFVVDKDGSVKDISILRNLEGGCGKAAKKVVESMNNMSEKWTPGKQRGRPVKVLFTLPIRFTLKG